MRWYVRNKNKVIGPFPTGQIQQAVLLGRISAHAEVSRDQQEWKPLRQCPQLIPDIMKEDTSDDHNRERLAAARRWADERRRERRAAEDDPNRKGPGRRNEESYTTLEYRDHRESVVRSLQPRKERALIIMLFVVLLIGAGVYAGFRWVPTPPALPKCDAAAAPGVNWRLCNKAGAQLLNTNLNNAILNSANLQDANLLGSQFIKADLSYADLSSSNLSYADFHQASLKGANLRAADLSKADLTAADLSYANLKGATLHDTELSNTKLSNAIWVDGRTCLAGSVGVCRFSK